MCSPNLLSKLSVDPTYDFGYVTLLNTYTKYLILLFQSTLSYPPRLALLSERDGPLDDLAMLFNIHKITEKRHLVNEAKSVKILLMIIGITGTLGAGKGAVVDCLCKNHGFKHMSARKYLTREVAARGLPLNRDSLTEVANDLRAKRGPSFIIEELYKEAERAGGNTIIESIRTLGEVEFLKNKKDFYLLAIDADIKTRYQRIADRGSETDNISFEKFLLDEKREIDSQDPTKGNIAGCMKLADFKIQNDGTLEELERKIEEFLEKIK